MSYKISLLQNAAFRLCTRGRPISAAVWPVWKTQGFAEQHCWPCVCRDTVLIGNVPTEMTAASRHAVRDHMACLEHMTRPVSRPCRPMVLTRVLNQTADDLLRTGSLPSAAAQQEEAERNLARGIKRLTSLKTQITRTKDHVPTPDKNWKVTLSLLWGQWLIYIREHPPRTEPYHPACPPIRGRVGHRAHCLSASSTLKCPTKSFLV